MKFTSKQHQSHAAMFTRFSSSDHFYYWTSTPLWQAKHSRKMCHPMFHLLSLMQFLIWPIQNSVITVYMSRWIRLPRQNKFISPVPYCSQGHANWYFVMSIITAARQHTVMTCTSQQCACYDNVTLHDPMSTSLLQKLNHLKVHSFIMFTRWICLVM